MKNQVLLTALKWIGIQYALMLTIGFGFFYLLKENQIALVFGSVLMYLGQMVFFALGVRELEQKLGKGMSPQKAFELVGWFVGVSFAFGFLAFVVMELFTSTSSFGGSSGRGFGLGTSIAMFGLMFLYMLFIYLIPLMFYGMWRIFTKAGKPGWASIVPIYNAVVQCEIGKQPTWYVIMLFIPIVNIVFAVMMMNGISKAFGKDEGFTVGLVLLPFVFIPILGFGPERWIYGPQEVDDEGSNIEDHLVA